VSTSKFWSSERFPRLVILLSGIISLWVASNIYWGGEHYTGILRSDGKGYYAYLPAVFIYQDLNFSWIDQIEYEKYKNPNYFYDFRSEYKGKHIDKYYVGTAICMMPFFGLAHAITLLTGGDADGYTKWYQISAHWAALFWLLIALWAINAFLKTYAFQPKLRAWVLLLVYFGSNWFYYVIGEPSMSHAYSVALIALFALMLRRWLLHGAHLYVLWACFLIGWIFITRPVNILAAGMVFPITGNWRLMRDRIMSWYKGLPTGGIWLYLIAAVLMIVPQSVIYFIQTGEWWIYSYQEEGFDFLNPEWFNVLFSYKKGFFIYTPIMLFGLAGFVGLYRSNRFSAWTLCLLLVGLVYVFSSWWNWYYGGSFSQRVFVDFYVLFAWLMAYSIDQWKQLWQKQLWLGVMVLLLLLNQFQTYQYRYNLIHWSEMTRATYWEVFLQLPQ
jgi:hypothetical protein